MSTRPQTLTHHDYELALLSQSAPNFIALLNSYHDIAQRIPYEDLAGHPITLLFMTQFNHLTHAFETALDFGKYSEAHATCEERAKNPPQS